MNNPSNPGPVEQELLESTGIKPKTGEKRQAFLKRLNAAVNNAYDADPKHVAWENLSQDAQQWVNNGNEAKGDIPDFAGAEEQPDTEAANTEGTKMAAKSKKTAEKKTTAAKPAATDAKPEKKASATNGAKKPGKFETIIRTALKHPKKTGEELADMLPDFSRSSVVTVRSDLKRTTRVLADVGLLKENPF